MVLTLKLATCELFYYTHFMFLTIITNVQALIMPAQTENFNVKTDPRIVCTCGHPNCDKRSVKQRVLNRVQMIRDEANRPLTITSGGRCPNHPDEVHRTKPADHQNCVGVDIKVNNGLERMEIVRLGMKYGATAIGVAKTFVHLGWRQDSPDVMWTY